MKKPLRSISRFLEKELDPAFARRARLVLLNIDVKSSSKILDVGCGRGFYELAVSSVFPGTNVIGIDLNEKYLSVGRRAVNDKHVTFLKADGTDLPFKDNSFDQVICSEVLEHIPNDALMLREIHRVVKKGGKVIVTVPNKNYPFFWDPLNFILERVFRTHIPANIWWLAGIWADHVRLYTKKELVNKVKNSAFDIIRTYDSTAYCLPFSHFLLYGIGKNLVERGFVGKQFNRFDTSPRSNISLLVQSFFSLFDRYNIDDMSYTRFVNLILVAKKR